MVCIVHFNLIAFLISMDFWFVNSFDVTKKKRYIDEKGAESESWQNNLFTFDAKNYEKNHFSLIYVRNVLNNFGDIALVNKSLKYESDKSAVPAKLKYMKSFELKKNNLKRNLKKNNGFTEMEKVNLLSLHNLYRNNVTPSASDMSFMEWDETLEDIAQVWAENCVFDHGIPPEYKSYEGKVGQNLYSGGDSSGTRALYLWYIEYLDYDFETRKCNPGKKCGHYTQMVWADSTRLGCGVSRCEKYFLVVCQYGPSGNIRGSAPYRVGKPCSQCSENNSGLCTNNLCVTKEQCKRNSPHCSPSCPLKCHNCGILDSENCRCHCLHGWDTLDCSRPCADWHEWCGKSPGWPGKAACSLSNHQVGKKFCRKMCGKCDDFMYQKWNEAKNETCCGGIACPDGYVLDLQRRLCKCRLLCPGPKCNKSRGSGFDIIKDKHLILLLLLLLYYRYHFFHQ